MGKRGKGWRQICWQCKHATNKYGVCSWSARLKPVEGWEAEKVERDTGEYMKNGITYHVYGVGYQIKKCPLFEEDNE